MKAEKREEIKEKILECTEAIVEKEGFQKVSIRKVAKLAGYTPGSIYQYFENKDELISKLVRQGYKKIIESTAMEIDKNMSIEKQIIRRFENYIKTALDMPEYYKAVMLNDGEEIKKVTFIFDNKDTSRAIDMLEKLIKKGMESGEFKKGDYKKVTRIIWTANFGLTLRLIIEKQQKEELINELIKEQFEIIFNGIKKEK